MKRALVLAPLVVALTALTGLAAAAGPSPGARFGSPGIVSHDGKLRYLALRAGRGTLVESVATNGGAVRHSRFLNGFYGVPMVAYDGTAGGLSRDGRRLVLVQAKPAETRFVVLDPRTLKVRARVALNGGFGFDALSPDGSLLYLIHLKPNSGLSYEVRALDLGTGRLFPEAIVDRREPGEKMNGIPLTRIGNGDGSWAYTLYMRGEKAPFVHALHTTHREAFCIDVPMRVRPEELSRVRMRLAGGKLLLKLRGRTLASVDTDTFEVR
jgi:hypothetical protein